jgi:hypothetical protein
MIIPSIKAIAQQFHDQLLDEYHEDFRNIPKCYKMYLGFLKAFGGKQLKQYVQWQVDAEIKALYNPKIDFTRTALETVDIRTRRGGKTRKLSNIATFGKLLDWRVIWRTPFYDQLDQAANWFHINPFVSKVRIDRLHEVEILNLDDKIDIGILSPGQSSGKECELLIFDEGGLVIKRKKVYVNYKECRPFVASCVPKIIAHATTPARYTAVEEAWLEAKDYEMKYDTELTFLHTDDDCSWITEEWVEKERLLNIDTPWYVDQNYKCKWVVYGGAVFNNIKTPQQFGDPDVITNLLKRKDLKIKAGVDFNGELEKHYLVEIVQYDNVTYILREMKFIDLSFLLTWQRNNPTGSLELEDGLFNTQFTEQTKRIGLDCIYNAWNEQNKMERVAWVRNKIIVIDPQYAPLTYRNLLEAGYDQNSRLPKLEKRTDQHGLDAYLHAEHEFDGRIYTPQHPEPQASVFQKNKGRFLDYQG